MAIRSAISASRASAVATLIQGDGSAVIKLSAYRLLPDRAPPRTSVIRMPPPAAAACVKGSCAEHELPDQCGEADPDDQGPCKPRRQFGDARAHAARDQRDSNRKCALDRDKSEEIRAQWRGLRAEDRFAERVAVEEA